MKEDLKEKKTFKECKGSSVQESTQERWHSKKEFLTFSDKEATLMVLLDKHPAPQQQMDQIFS